MLLVVLLNLAGALLLGVGLLVTIPLSFCAVTVAYAEIFGLPSRRSIKHLVKVHNNFL